MKNNFKLGVVSILLTLFLSSCAIYKQEFECPPPPGVACTSVTDLEKMVVETDQGPDLFLPLTKEKSNPCFCKKTHQMKDGETKGKVWVCHASDDDNCFAKGHYAYQTTRYCPLPSDPENSVCFSCLKQKSEE